MTAPIAALLLVAAAGTTRPIPALIDRHVGDGLRKAAIAPAPPADDAALFRRAHLALAGRTPLAADARAFLADADPDKRAKLVDRLLASPAFANHFAALWRGWLIPEASANPEVAGLAPGFEAWLRPRFAANERYDKLVRDLLTAPVNNRTALVAPVRPRGDDLGDANPMAFYIAKEAKPENLAAATSRLFLGIQLECAQCHNHPFAKWSREQFWGVAAFFGGMERTGGAIREVTDRRELPIPNTDRVAPPAFLDDTEPQWAYKSTGRVTLANWVTDAKNPFFAKAAVNRVWGYLFGVGLVDPVDDFNEKNPPSHPELLDELAAAFAAGGFDLKALVRGIVLSDAYQRASAATASPVDVRLYARFPVQGLTPEQLFDSLTVAVGGPPAGADRRTFLELFAAGNRPTEAQTTILQALSLMNGPAVAAATSIGNSRTLGAVVGLPGLTPAERVEAIYFAVLSRPPTAAERDRAVRHVTAGDSQRYADVMWALLNGVEFRTNH